MASKVDICLTSLAVVALVALSASGTREVVGAERQVYVVAAAGGKVEQVTRGDLAGHSPSWAPAGRRLAYVQGRHISVFDLQTGSS